MANSPCIIEIESDPELDAEIIDHYAPRRLIPDQRLNRPRDNLSRFVSSAQADTSAVVGDHRVAGEDDDDLEITGEVSLREDGPINNDATYINLDQHENTNDSRVMVVPHREGDDDLMLVEERISEPRSVLLQLPGGQTIQVHTSWDELPVGSSFQNQMYNNPNRLRRLRQHIGRATDIFMRDDEQGDGHSVARRTIDNSDYLPPDIREARNQSILQRRMRDQRERQQSRQRLNRVSAGEIDSLEPELRSLFYESQSLSQFREGIARFNFPPARLEQLLRQYSDFRSRAMQQWAAQRRTRSIPRNGRNTHSQDNASVRGSRMTRSSHPANRRGQSQFGEFRDADSNPSGSVPLYQTPYGPDSDDDDNDALERSLNDEITGPELLQRVISNTIGRRFGNFPFGIGPDYEFYDDDDPANTEYIIRMIQEREERDASSRTKKLNEVTKKQQQKYINKANSLPEGYSSSFNTSPMMSMTLENNGAEEKVMVTDDEAAKSYEDIPVCVLCGTELGLGIPSDFKGISDKDKGVSFEALQSKYKSLCPYQTLARPTDVDRDISRRTFISSCGHAFCGRCFVRIDNARTMSTKLKNKLKGLKGPSHPDNYGPKQCPAAGCRCILRKRGMMREVYF